MQPGGEGRWKQKLKRSVTNEVKDLSTLPE